MTHSYIIIGGLNIGDFLIKLQSLRFTPLFHLIRYNYDSNNLVKKLLLLLLLLLLQACGQHNQVQGKQLCNDT